MAALREVLAKFGFDVDSSKLISAQTAVNGLIGGIGNLSGLAGGLAGAAGLAVFKSQADDLAAEATELGRAATKAGIPFQEFQKLTYTSGLSAEKLTAVFRKLQQTTAAAGGKADDAALAFDDLDGGMGRVANSKQATATLKQLGVTVTEDTGQNFDAIVAALAKMPDKLQRNALAMKVFGRAGSDLIPFLEKSPEDLSRLSEEFDAFGGFTDASRAKLKQYTDANKALNLATKSLRIALVTALVPAFTAVIRGAVEVGKWFSKGVDGSNLFAIAIGLVGGAFVLLKAQAVASAIATVAAWARVVLPIAIAAVVLDDLIHFMKGDASTAIEALIKSLYGDEEGKSKIAKIREELDEFDDGSLLAKITKPFAALDLALETIVKGAWAQFWEAMNEGLTGGAGGFSEFFSSVFERMGIVAWNNLLQGIKGLLNAGGGMGLGALGLADKLGITAAADKAEAAKNAYFHGVNQRKATNADRAPGLDDGGAVPFGPVNPALQGLVDSGKAGFVPTFAPGGSGTAKVDVANNRTLQQTNNVVINAYGNADGVEEDFDNWAGDANEKAANALEAKAP